MLESGCVVVGVLLDCNSDVRLLRCLGISVSDLVVLALLSTDSASDVLLKLCRVRRAGVSNNKTVLLLVDTELPLTVLALSSQLAEKVRSYLLVKLTSERFIL